MNKKKPFSNFELHEKQQEALELLRDNKDIMEYLMVGGSRCLAEGTLLNGIPVEKHKKRRFIVVRDEKRYRLASSPKYVGDMEALEIDLANGEKVTVSYDHKFYAKGGLAHGSWVRAGGLTTKDYIAVESCAISKSKSIVSFLKRFRENIVELHDAYFGFDEQLKIVGSNGEHKHEMSQDILSLIGAMRKEYPEVSYDYVSPDITCHYGKVKAIKPVGIKRMYSLTVADSKRYMAHGILHANSGKTFFGIHLLIVRALMYPKSRHIIVRLRFSHAKTSIWLDTLPKVMDAMGLVEKRDYKKNRSDFFISFRNGSEVWIDGLDNAERVEKMLGREYNTIYYNEISQIPYDTVTTVQSRLALKAYSEKYGVCRNYSLYDANPPTKKHWSYFYWFLGKDPGERDKPELSEERKKTLAYIKMNPQDNIQNVGENYIQLLQNLPEKKRKRFLDGEYSDVEGTIYENWQIVKQIPSHVRKTAQVTLGGDFGFSVDPACVVRIYFIRKPFGKGELWIEQLVYERGLTNQKLAEKLYYEIRSKDKRVAWEESNKECSYQDFRGYSSLDMPVMCYMDGHEPKSITEMQETLNNITNNILVAPGLLGQDARRAGIDWLQNMDMFVTEDSVDVITEFETYEYKKDGEGNPTQDPVEDDDHAMDAIRYGCSPFISKNTAVVLGVGAS